MASISGAVLKTASQTPVAWSSILLTVSPGPVTGFTLGHSDPLPPLKTAQSSIQQLVSPSELFTVSGLPLPESGRSQTSPSGNNAISSTGISSTVAVQVGGLEGTQLVQKQYHVLISSDTLSLRSQTSPPALRQSKHSPSARLGPVVGGAIGGILILAIFVVVTLKWRLRGNQKGQIFIW